MILAKNQCDWLHLVAFTPTTDLKNLRSLAFYYAGLEVPSEFQETASLACAELQQWDRSFLKMYYLVVNEFAVVLETEISCEVSSFCCILYVFS